MRVAHIGRVDLNLLPALIALLEECHVSRAEPIMDRLATAVPQLEDIFAGAEFDPSTTVLEIRVAGSDYTQAVVGPGLAGRIGAASPGSTLRFHPWHGEVLAELADGVVDLAFIGAQEPEYLRGEEVFTDRFVCVVAADHPLAGRRALGLADYLACRHLVIDVVDGRQPAIDRVLSARGTPRRAGLILPVHVTAPLTLPGTDLVLTLPARLAGHYAGGDGLRILDVPDEIGTMAYRMIWHPRLDLDPVHRWLRALVRDAVADFG